VGDLLSTAGIDRAIVLDPHSAALEAMCSIPVEVVTANQALTEALRPHVMPNAVVVAPDEGALKLAEHFASELGLGLGFVRKHRLSGEEVSIGTVVGDVAGRPVVLVDDMISTGATIAAAIAALLERQALSDFVVAATHGLFVGQATKRLRELPVRRLFMTDSLPPPCDVPCPTTVVGVGPLLARRINQLHGGSVPDEDAAGGVRG
jgi:ribose-phosphate pyrophosphokinase